MREHPSTPHVENSTAPARPSAARASFTLDRTSCFVMDEGAPVACNNLIGALTLGERRYVILAARGGYPAGGVDLLDLLSPRELEIAFHLAAGSDCKMVARTLRISFHTVRVHLGRAYAKLGLHKQTELVAIVAGRFGTQPALESRLASRVTEAADHPGRNARLVPR